MRSRAAGRRRHLIDVQSPNTSGAPAHSAEKCTALNTRYAVHRITGNAGGGKGPQFKTNAVSGEGQEIGQPSNSGKCSEAAEGVTRESKGRAGLPLLRVVRQDLSRR